MANKSQYRNTLLLVLGSISNALHTLIMKDINILRNIIVIPRFLYCLSALKVYLP